MRTGFGPETWIARDPSNASGLTARVHYYERGPMGAALGSVQAIAHDGRGGLTITTHPFTITEQGGALSLPLLDS